MPYSLLLVGYDVAQTSCKSLARVGLRQQLYARVQLASVNDGIFRVTGGEEDGEVGQPLLGFAAPFHCFSLTGHHDIGEDDIDGNAAFRDRQACLRIPRGQNPVAEIRQRFDDASYLIIVLNDENGFTAADGAALHHDFTVFVGKRTGR